MGLEWMYWTNPTAIFFHQHFPDDRRYACLGTGVADHRTSRFSDRSRRHGGQDFFWGLLGSAYIHLAWLGLTDLALWYATIISLVWVIVVMRWG